MKIKFPEGLGTEGIARSMTFIADIKDGDHILGHYFCKFKQTLRTKAGKPYYSIKLQDKTGVVETKVWDITSDIQDFDEGEMIKIDADALLYQGEMQLKVYKLRRSREEEYNLADFVPVSKKGIDKMYAQIVGYIDTVQDPFIKTLLQNIVINDPERANAFKSRSAAKSMHHGYMGGLLEHTLAVVEICNFVASQYEYINRDLLLAGAILHDFGKIYELTPMPHNEYSDDGQMLGHIVIGVEMVGAEAAKIENFPRQLASLIKHMIISHHGEFEYGSPKLPSIAEAMLLHFADNMDAKLKTIEEVIESDVSPGPWAGYQKALNRYIRKSEF